MSNQSGYKSFIVNEHTELRIIWGEGFNESCLNKVAQRILNDKVFADRFRVDSASVFKECGVLVTVYRDGILTDESIYDVINTDDTMNPIIVGVIIGLML